MGKIVYIVGGKCELMKAILEENGYEVILGDGTRDDDALARCDALMPGMPNRFNVTQEVLDSAPNLKIVARTGVGVDRIDVPACTARGVYCSNTPLANYIPVAEQTIMFMLALAKQVWPIARAMHGEAPDSSIKNRVSMAELCGKTLVLIGLGNIGRRTAHLAAAFGMKLIGVVRRPVDPALLPEGMEQTTALEEALPRGDYVSLHLTGSEENRNYIGAKELALMKQGAIFINTTRGFIVNEQALTDALQTGWLAGAGLDHVLSDTLEAGNPLAMMDNVIITPANTVETPETMKRAQEQCAKNIVDALEGGPPEHGLNGSVC